MKKWLKRLAIIFLLLLLAGALALYQGDLPKEYVDEKYSSPASQFLTADSGGRIHFRDEGRSDGPPVVLVHGSNSSLHTWEPWVEILGEKYRVITLDLPAHGLTGSVPDGDYSTASQLATVDAVVEHLGIDRFVLGGNSMGGGVTWRYTLKHPEKVKAMILVNAAGPQQWSDEVAQASSDDDKRGPLVFQLLRHGWFRPIARYMDPYLLTKQGLRSAYANDAAVTDELIERYYELSLREGTRAAIMDRFAHRAGQSAVDAVDLAELQQPTLIMWGREDAVISVNVAEKFAETLPNHSLVIYDDVGHLPMEEVPEKSADAVLSFLAEVRGEPPVPLRASGK